MDIRCPKCGEAWSLDELHYTETATGKPRSFDTARRLFRRQGCGVFGESCGPCDQDAAEVADMLFTMYGEDIDGIAADSEEFLAFRRK